MWDVCIALLAGNEEDGEGDLLRVVCGSLGSKEPQGGDLQVMLFITEHGAGLTTSRGS